MPEFPSRIKIAVADDHVLMRSALVNCLNDQEHMQVIAEASDGQTLLELLKSQDAPPDVCLLDVRMPNGGGYHALIELKAAFPTTRFIILTMMEHELLMVRMYQAGATGYILKDMTINELLEGIQCAYEGQCHFPGRTGSRILSGLRATPDQAKARRITGKEEEFLRWCLHVDLGYKQIAQAMGVTENTIKGHRETLFKKVGEHTRTGLVLFALELGLSKI
jgi:two-component system invasion response regulator UvrY